MTTSFSYRPIKLFNQRKVKEVDHVVSTPTVHLELTSQAKSSILQICEQGPTIILVVYAPTGTGKSTFCNFAIRSWVPQSTTIVDYFESGFHADVITEGVHMFDGLLQIPWSSEGERSSRNFINVILIDMQGYGSDSQTQQQQEMLDTVKLFLPLPMVATLTIILSQHTSLREVDIDIYNHALFYVQQLRYGLQSNVETKDLVDLTTTLSRFSFGIKGDLSMMSLTHDLEEQVRDFITIPRQDGRQNVRDHLFVSLGNERNAIHAFHFPTSLKPSRDLPLIAPFHRADNRFVLPLPPREELLSQMTEQDKLSATKYISAADLMLKDHVENQLREAATKKMIFGKDVLACDGHDYIFLLESCAALISQAHNNDADDSNMIGAFLDTQSPMEPIVQYLINDYCRVLKEELCETINSFAEEIYAKGYRRHQADFAADTSRDSANDKVGGAASSSNEESSSSSTTSVTTTASTIDVATNTALMNRLTTEAQELVLTANNLRIEWHDLKAKIRHQLQERRFVSGHLDGRPWTSVNTRLDQILSSRYYQREKSLVSVPWQVFLSDCESYLNQFEDSLLQQIVNALQQAKEKWTEVENISREVAAQWDAYAQEQVAYSAAVTKAFDEAVAKYASELQQANQQQSRRGRRGGFLGSFLGQAVGLMLSFTAPILATGLGPVSIGIGGVAAGKGGVKLLNNKR